MEAGPELALGRSAKGTKQRWVFGNDDGRAETFWDNGRSAQSSTHGVPRTCFLLAELPCVFAARMGGVQA